MYYNCKYTTIFCINRNNTSINNKKVGNSLLATRQSLVPSAQRYNLTIMSFSSRNTEALFTLNAALALMCGMVYTLLKLIESCIKK